MKKILIAFFLLINSIAIFAQRGYNYYKDSIKNGSANERAFTYFKKAYYDCIWKWTTAGADSAEYYLKLAIQEDSNYTAAYAFLAHVYQFKTYKAEDFDKYFALQKKYAEKALSFNPQTGDTYSVMADVAWTEHDTTRALNLLQNAIAREPDNVGNYLWIAIRYRQMKQEKYYDSAAISLHRIMLLDPEYGQAYMKLGNVFHLDKHQYDSAKIYYQKTIEIYNNVKPKDSRMMDAYYWLGEVFKTENRYDSAICYYKLFLKEMEPSDMYIRDMRLAATYKALYECNQSITNNSLRQFLEFSKSRIAKDSANTNLLFETLEGNYMTIDQDSVYEKYALPLARHLQTFHSSDPYLKIFATDDEFVILKKLKRNNEALKVLEKYNLSNPKEPVILFDLARMKFFTKDNQAGFVYLKKAKQNLNNVFTEQVFLDQLSNSDFDGVRNTSEFKKLIE
jgi:tetratricopeptide (TPR) repeat protein